MIKPGAIIRVIVSIAVMFCFIHIIQRKIDGDRISRRAFETQQAVWDARRKDMSKKKNVEDYYKAKQEADKAEKEFTEYVTSF